MAACRQRRRYSVCVRRRNFSPGPKLAVRPPSGDPCAWDSKPLTGSRDGPDNDVDSLCHKNSCLVRLNDKEQRCWAEGRGLF
jgi:hypothetical protein